MKYAVEMGSGAMMYIPSFHTDWFRYSVVNKGEFVDRQHGNRISPLYFF
jgi:hypothetical protein